MRNWLQIELTSLECMLLVMMTRKLCQAQQTCHIKTKHYFTSHTIVDPLIQANISQNLLGLQNC